MAFFRHIYKEKINLVRDPSLSQQHTHEIWELVLHALLHNRLKQTLNFIGETIN